MSLANVKSKGLLLDIPLSLSTDRLDLRVPVPGQGALANAAIVESIAELNKWMPWARPTPAVEDTETWVRQAHARFILREDIPYLMFLRGTDELVGGFSLFNINFSVPRAEIGYWQRTKYTGNGYMIEAVRAAVRLGFHTLRAERLEIRCDDRNTKSGRVAERAGFQLEGVLRRHGRGLDGELTDTRIYSLLRQ